MERLSHDPPNGMLFDHYALPVVEIAALRSYRTPVRLPR